jgi:hypothetical protein
MILRRPAVVVDRAARPPSFHFVATFLPLARWRDVPAAFSLSSKIEAQLKATPGVARYSLAVDPLRRRFWTCSVWSEPSAIAGFVRAEPHATAVRRMGNWGAEGGAFVSWQSTSPEIHWDEAFQRLENPSRYYVKPV